MTTIPFRSRLVSSHPTSHLGTDQLASLPARLVKSARVAVKPIQYRLVYAGLVASIPTSPYASIRVATDCSTRHMSWRFLSRLHSSSRALSFPTTHIDARLFLPDYPPRFVIAPRLIRQLASCPSVSVPVNPDYALQFGARHRPAISYPTTRVLSGRFGHFGSGHVRQSPSEHSHSVPTPQPASIVSSLTRLLDSRPFSSVLLRLLDSFRRCACLLRPDYSLQHASYSLHSDTSCQFNPNHRHSDSDQFPSVPTTPLAARRFRAPSPPVRHYNPERTSS